MQHTNTTNKEEKEKEVDDKRKRKNIEKCKRYYAQQKKRREEASEKNEEIDKLKRRLQAAEAALIESEKAKVIAEQRAGELEKETERLKRDLDEERRERRAEDEKSYREIHGWIESSRSLMIENQRLKKDEEDAINMRLVYAGEAAKELQSTLTKGTHWTTNLQSYIDRVCPEAPISADEFIHSTSHLAQKRNQLSHVSINVLVSKPSVWDAIMASTSPAYVVVLRRMLKDTLAGKLSFK